MTNKQEKSSLGDLLLHLRRNIVEAIRKEGLQDDLTFSQVEVLYFIGPNGKQTMKSIAEFLKISPPSATEIIADMEKKGLVRRVSDKKDRRVVFIMFTATAQKIFHSIYRRKESILKKMIAKLNKADRKNLERIIKILIA